jgi:hypothetical protein
VQRFAILILNNTRANIMTTAIETILGSRIVPDDEEPCLWLIPDYGLTVMGNPGEYDVMIWPNDNDHYPYDFEDWLMKKASAEDISKLIEILDHDLARAKQWIEDDVAEGFFPDPATLTNLTSVGKFTDENLYILGAGDEARNLDEYMNMTDAAEAKIDANEKELRAAKVIGHRTGQSFASRLEIYFSALTFSFDKWLQSGGLTATLSATTSTTMKL